MDKYAPLQFFWEVVQAAVNMEPNKYGSPVSYLLENLILYQEDFLKRVLTVRGHSCEIRINGAGLKVYVNVELKRITIGGDQEDLYPEFVEKIRELIREHQFTGITWENKETGMKMCYMRFTTIR